MNKSPFKKATLFSSLKERLLYRYLNFIDAGSVKSSDKDNTEKWVLLVKLDLLGDYVLIRNFLKAIKNSERFKGHKLAFCCNVGIEELSKHLDKDVVDEWIPLKLKPFLKDKEYRRSSWSQLLKRHYAAALFPTQSRSFFYDDLIAKNVSASAKIGAQGNGYNQLPWQHRQGAGYFTELVQLKEENGFEYLKNKAYFHAVLAEDSTPDLPKITASQKPSQSTILLSPGASAEFRRWSTAHFIALTESILKAVPDCKVIVSGSPGEKHLGNTIKQSFANDDRVHNRCGELRLSELTEVLATCHLVVSNESGTVHLARAIGVKHIYCISNGNHFGRFNPYPSSKEGIELSYFYPIEVRSILNGQHPNISQSDLYWGSRIPIDTVNTQEVIGQFEKEFSEIFQTV